MFNPLSIGRSLINPLTLAQVAMGPAGWASIAARAIGSAIGKQVIQALGQQLGLPQGIIGLAQNAFSAATGTRGGPLNIRDAVSQLSNQFGLSPFQQAQLTRGAERSLSQLIDNLGSEILKNPELKGSRGKSWLMAIAEALGRTADKLANEMDAMAKQLGKGDESSRASDNLKFGAKSQEFAQFFSAANTVIKTLGEALAAGSRKQ